MTRPLLFEPDQIPRRKRRVMMHVVDAGSGMIEFECKSCDHNTGWIVDEQTVTENKRGLPCPKCNETLPKQTALAGAPTAT